MNWRNWKWDKIIWTDEKIFELYPLNKKIRMKIKDNESISDFTFPKVE
jgi:hypothetical protein